jgi:hypothetical protein
MIAVFWDVAFWQILTDNTTFVVTLTTAAIFRITTVRKGDQVAKVNSLV